MLTVLSFALVALGCVLSIPVAVYCLEVILGLTAPPRSAALPPEPLIRPRVAVLVPAHDEGDLLLPTIADLRAQLRPGDRLLVVADNCTDDTAAIAAGAGAEVVERNDPSARGKGYALDFGIRNLGRDPPEIVLVVDADCRLGPGVVNRLAVTCWATQRPAQACYLITSPPGAPNAFRIAAFAQFVKNRLRPRGLQILNLPCQLAGSGMAFPWRIIAAAELGSGEIVEDLKLGLDFAAAGHPAVFCPEAEVTSYFPTSPKGAAAQRQRWQHGHLRMMIASARNIAIGLSRRDRALLALTLDLMVPPLTLLLVSIGLLALLSAAAASLGASPLALAIVAANLVALTGVTLAAWRRFDRGAMGWSSIAAYIGERILLYPRLLSGKPLQWVRTERDAAGELETRRPSRP